jgi:hypothetical protein
MFICPNAIECLRAARASTDRFGASRSPGETHRAIWSTLQDRGFQGRAEGRAGRSPSDLPRKVVLVIAGALATTARRAVRLAWPTTRGGHRPHRLWTGAGSAGRTGCRGASELSKGRRSFVRIFGQTLTEILATSGIERFRGLGGAAQGGHPCA